jgi:farnesyl-diphosphate farnesyltransferase
VAGLVGEGLTRLFARFESPSIIETAKTLGNTMGLFLQKTNITRDFLEDLRDGRAFWPKEIWGKYASSLEDLAQKKDLACLNHMVTDALQCVPECLSYMSQMKTPEIFKFCAIT